ncbi:Decapping nuclease [Caenorhabditis elegans]|uniref:Decapping nuclease n=1 Tax=Caenorhabditis elegans TaxID=6239 RepID=O62316_CAEEL|nr:Decapping nuclease [Caenorhabditis elegans]CAB04619.3 Decapping nuclease [Caenorhabditis elegans]
MPIQVETIGYYHRDSELNITPNLLPKVLNENKKYLEDPTLPFPYVDVQLKVPDNGGGEKHMESVLSYLNQMGWPNKKKPDFVTNRHTITTIATTGFSSKEQAQRLLIFRYSGVIFLLKSSEFDDLTPDILNYAIKFEHFFKKTSDEEPVGGDGTVRKAVFKATIPRGNEHPYSVLYSGEMDAIYDEESREHVELKVFVNGLDNYKWKFRSCWMYWQAFFSNVPTLVIGSRTGKEYQSISKHIPGFSLYKVEKLERDSIPSTAAAKHAQRMGDRPFPPKIWSVAAGERHLRVFLQLVKETAISDGDCFVLSRNGERSRWIIERDEESVAEFRKVIVKSMPK